MTLSSFNYIFATKVIISFKIVLRSTKWFSQYYFNHPTLLLIESFNLVFYFNTAYYFPLVLPHSFPLSIVSLTANSDYQNFQNTKFTNLCKMYKTLSLPQISCCNPLGLVSWCLNLVTSICLTIFYLPKILKVEIIKVDYYLK